MTDLAQFLLERIAEDEGAGTAGTYWDLAEALRSHGMGLAADWLTAQRARVLAECEAKRQIVEAARRYPEFDSGEWAFNLVLAHLAAPFSSHPDFRSEWTV